MRTFLTDKKIIGVMLVSQCADLLDITIPNLLKWTDWCLIIMDNQSKEVEEKVYEYQRQNHDTMFVRRSSIPHKLFSKSGKELNYHERWKSIKGVVRNDIFVNLRCILDWKKKGYDHIDILLLPDHDVIFTNYLPELLERFLDSDYKAITMKHIDVINDMKTITSSGIGHHVHIVKYNRELAGLPRRFYAIYHPLQRKDLMPAQYYSIHLAYFTEKNRKWRADNWKNYNVMERKMYKLNKSVEETNPSEIINVLKNN